VSFADARETRHNLTEKLAVGGHILNAHLDQVVKATSDHVTFQNFVKAQSSFCKFVENVAADFIKPASKTIRLGVSFSADLLWLHA
jgi:hypothetical protein